MIPRRLIAGLTVIAVMPAMVSVSLAEQVYLPARLASVPLPNDIDISKPDPALPSNYNAFLGAWGLARGSRFFRPTVLVVKSVNKNGKARVVYALGKSNRFVSLFENLPGKIEGITLTVEATRDTVVTYKLKGDSLSATWRRDQKSVFFVMDRLQTSAASPEKTFDKFDGSWRALRTCKGIRNREFFVEVKNGIFFADEGGALQEKFNGEFESNGIINITGSYIAPGRFSGDINYTGRILPGETKTRLKGFQDSENCELALNKITPNIAVASAGNSASSRKLDQFAAKCDDPLPEVILGSVAPGAPAEAQKFLGIWGGRWGGFLCSRLAVQSVDANGIAKYFYSWGRLRNGADPGFSSGRARIEDGELKFGGRAKFKFQFTAKGLLIGERELGSITGIVMMAKLLGPSTPIFESKERLTAQESGAISASSPALSRGDKELTELFGGKTLVGKTTEYLDETSPIITAGSWLFHNRDGALVGNKIERERAGKGPQRGRWWIKNRRYCRQFDSRREVCVSFEISNQFVRFLGRYRFAGELIDGEIDNFDEKLAITRSKLSVAEFNRPKEDIQIAKREREEAERQARLTAEAAAQERRAVLEAEVNKAASETKKAEAEAKKAEAEARRIEALVKLEQIKKEKAEADAARLVLAAKERRDAEIARQRKQRELAEQQRREEFEKRKFARRFDIAVIIGNSNYTRLGRDIPDVTPASRDAEAFKDYVTASLGIIEDNIIFLRDATLADLVATFGNDRTHKGQLFRLVEPGKSRVHVYYVGHGAPAGDEASSYIIPVDATADNIVTNGYLLATLYRNLSLLKAKSVRVVLEACFSGQSQAGTVILNASPVYNKAVQADIPANISVIAAGAANQIASWTKDKSRSLFTKYYLDGINGAADKAPYGNGDGEVGDGELRLYLERTTTRSARRNYGRTQNVQFTNTGPILATLRRVKKALGGK